MENNEIRTAKMIADRLRPLGIEVTEGIAVTGIVGVLKGGKPGFRAHGASPWSGVDTIVTSSQIITGLQTILSRSVNVTQNPARSIGKQTTDHGPQPVELNFNPFLEIQA